PLARLASARRLEPDEAAPESATALVGTLKILIPMAGLIDRDAELARLTKEAARRRKDLERGERKLANADFLERAPAEVVDKERRRVAELRDALARLDEQAERIRAL
ncbi:MAG TPA: valine--tRNA ligase, partial [Chromatiales bacterium]|nr:valine--tRNA ligase [Chromatiales bacterium]